ncbi:MAG: nuclear transport factor 2 family protein, partial [Rhizobacter sp.]|nr:nuclear transport factor 2 family protein [Rhizobacter sp.]
MGTSSNVELVQQAYTAFGAGDLPGLLGFMSPDIVWDFPRSSVIPFAGTFKGPDRVARFFAALVEHSDALTFEPRHFVGSEDRVVVLGSERFRVRAT